MRHFPEDDGDRKDAADMGAPEWMLEQLKLNNAYRSWGPYEDSMCDRDAGWRSPCFFDTWGDCCFRLDDLNEVVNFYFEINRNNAECEHCGGSGYNPATRRISDDWYDFARTGRRWCDNITQHEVDALWEAGRLKFDFRDGKPTAEQVNNWAKRDGFGGHDSINHYICVRARAQREGVYGKCEHCQGKGRVHIEEHCHLSLVLWVLHPRKGASRGVQIKDVKQEDLPQVYAYLREAAARNAERFCKIPETQLTNHGAIVDAGDGMSPMLVKTPREPGAVMSGILPQNNC